MRIFFLSLIVCYSLIAKANDGAYFASGNHLIPVRESQVSITKEVLKIERMENGYLLVHVNYIFYNPKEEKKILVGFEAPSPSGDVDGTPLNGKHPYISDFEVIMNGETLSFNCAIVRTEGYYTDKKINAISEQEAVGADFDRNYPDFFYVYHFNARFKHGINTVNHVYQFQLSSSTESLFSFEYILTAANRWANQQIDDFTLILDLGEFEDYSVERTFFTDSENWRGAAKFLEGKKRFYSEEEMTPLRIITSDAPVIYQQKNFKPDGELLIYKSAYSWEKFQRKVFDYQEDELPYDFESFQSIFQTKDAESYKVLRNLPFARRGYIFKNDLIQKYYESLSWYYPNPAYQADLNALSREEQEWLKKMKEQNE
ncbi:MAG: YARHG domain-containing protein [Bacteroidota bacterium]